MDDLKDFFFFFLVLLYGSVSSLELTGSSARLRSDARVPCLFTVDNPPVDPEHLTISWLFQDKEILSYNKSVRTTSSRYSMNTEVLGDGIANLTISEIQIPDGGMYKCSVSYRSEMMEKEIRLDIEAPPQVTITNQKDGMDKDSRLRCSALGFYPADINITWFRDGERLDRDIVLGDPWRNPDGTYSVSSFLTIIYTGEDGQWTFSCSVLHESLDEDLEVDFHLEINENSQAVPIFVFTCISVGLLVAVIIDIIVWRRRHYKKENIKGGTEDFPSSTESPQNNAFGTYNFSSKVGLPEYHLQDPGFRSWDNEPIGKCTRDTKDSSEKIGILGDHHSDPGFSYQEN